MPVIGGVREKELQYLEWAVAGEDMRSEYWCLCMCVLVGLMLLRGWWC